MRREVQREDSLHSDEYGGNLKLFKEDLQHFLLVLGGVHVGFGEQNGALIGCNFEEGKGVFPKQLHIVPMFNYTVTDWVFEFVESTLATEQFLPHISLELVAGAGNDHVVFGPAYSGTGDAYMEGKMCGFFSSPLKPTFMSPLPCLSK